jgi:hypothetical protein
MKFPTHNFPVTFYQHGTQIAREQIHRDLGSFLSDSRYIATVSGPELSRSMFPSLCTDGSSRCKALESAVLEDGTLSHQAQAYKVA